MKGYKAFDKGLICRGFKYEVGKTYKHSGEIGLCESGFHFCKTALDCTNYYDHTSSEFAEIEAIGKVIEGDGKCVTDEIKIARVISKREFYELANDGKNNVGVGNTGDCNTGNSNIGDCNTGNRNIGDWNIGDCNTGNRNIGDWNIGDWNTGSRNTGDCNTGNSNTGNRNTGNRNTGDWNHTNRSSGFFCTETQTVKIFDIDSGRTYQQMLAILPRVLWGIPFGCYWSNNELKTYTSEDRQHFYDNLSDDGKSKIKAIPHFNAEKFEKCTGIKVENEEVLQ